MGGIDQRSPRRALEAGQHEDAAAQCRIRNRRGCYAPAAGTTMTLEEFTPEGSKRGHEAPMSLHDLLARGTTVQWDEAVAIVEEMCAVAIAISGDHAPVSSLADVILDSNGRITLSGRGRGEESPTAAGRVLHAALANADVPVALRLFVTQSTAPETYRSLREFAAGLAYYARPNRTELIREVYKRGASLARSGVEPASIPPPLPLQDKEPPSRSPKSKRLDIKRAVLWSMAFVFVAVAAVAAWTWWKVGSRGTPTERVGVLSQAAAAVTDLASQVRERLRPAVSTNAEAPTETSATSSLPRPRRRAPAPTVAEETPVAGHALAIAQPDTWQLPVAVTTVGTPVLVAATTDAVPLDTEPTAVVKDSASPDKQRLFTKSDAEVEPPVMRYPQLTPPIMSRSSRPPAVNRVEVVVAPDGTVERARFVAGPIRMVDIMLLSSVKSWRFTPALKDGEPVRYQTVVSWLGTP